MEILLVDDEREILDLTSEGLAMAGHRITTAGGGREAFEKFQASPPDAVVADIRMGNGDGVELLEKIMTSGEPRPLFMFITGFTDITIEQALARGAADIFNKPFAIAAVQKRLAALHRQKQLAWGELPDQVALQETIGTSLVQAEADGSVSFGRGGMFLRSDRTLKPGAMVQVNVSQHGNLAGELSFVARVRWTRSAASPFFRQGAGLEVVWANRAATEFIRQRSNFSEVQAFIPIGEKPRTP